MVNSNNNDELLISVELSTELNPFNSADAHGDKDHDGLDNATDDKEINGRIFSWSNFHQLAQIYNFQPKPKYPSSY